MELQRKKTEGWELYRISKNFLEQNDIRWKKRNEKEQLENERIARLVRSKWTIAARVVGWPYGSPNKTHWGD